MLRPPTSSPSACEPVAIQPGPDGVDGDAVLGDVEREAARQAEHAGLGGAVRGLVRVGDHRAGHRAHVDDASVAALDHARHDAARDVELGLEVDGDAEVPLVFTQVLEGGEVLVLAEDDHAGVVDQHVDAAVALDDLGHHGADLVHLREVGGVRADRGAQLAQRGGALVGRLGDVADREERALLVRGPSRSRSRCCPASRRP